jgi:hypothetical protein
MEDFRTYAGERSWWTQLSLRSPQPPPRITFADLARVHHAWRADPDDPSLSKRYREAIDAFEYHQGEIDDAYWCLDRASGVAVTIQPFRRTLGWRPRYRFHRASAWVTQPDARVARLLNASDELGVRVSHILRGTSARICMGLVMNSSKALLALVDAPSQPPDAASRKEILRDEEAKLKTTEREYRRTATRQAQLVYVAGALAGAIFLTALVLLVLWLISLRTHLAWLPRDGGTGAGAQQTVSLSLLYLCAIAGGLGAIVSLIARINMNTCTVDYEAGRGVTFALGALRPALGAVFGIAFYAAIVSGLLDLFKVPTGDETKQFYFFLVIAFLSGFSERWARDVLVDLDGGKPTAAAPAAPREA